MTGLGTEYVDIYYLHDFVAAVGDSIEQGKNLQAEARDHEQAGEYARALETYDKAQALFEDARKVASDRNFPTDGIDQKLAAVEESRRDVQRHHLETEVAELRAELDKAETSIHQDDVSDAEEFLVDLRDRLESMKATAEHNDFEDLQSATSSLEHRADRLNAALRDRKGQRETLESNLVSLRADLDRISMGADEGLEGAARQELAELKTRLDKAKQSASRHGFNSLQDEITVLDQRREATLAAATQHQQLQAIPKEIPTVPNVSVDYGTVVDEEFVGSGGNADVYRVIVPTDEGELTLAIKKPRIAGTIHRNAIERMMEEAETWEKLDDHDHIVSVVDWGVDSGIPWIAMEYMDGRNLDDRIGSFSRDQALWTAVSVTRAVHFAHYRRGVAHLDLKPENVLFRTVDDAWDVPKVGDWGLSRHLIDQSRSIEGFTPAYAAPEQFDPDYGSVDSLTDVYQLGATFYTLFTGHPPFEGRPETIMRKVLDEAPQPPSEISDAPPALDDILLTALAKEQDDRYESVLYFRDQLQELLL